jgi:hypothetical protein
MKGRGAVDPITLVMAALAEHSRSPAWSPLTCDPWMDHGPLRLPPELRTHRYQRGTSRRGRPSNTCPGYITDITADLQLNAPLARVASCCTT